MVTLTILKKHQYCIVLNPVGSDGRSQLGVRELRVGPKSFFLQPGEDSGGVGDEGRVVRYTAKAIKILWIKSRCMS